jgi:hypothetical protein
MERSMNYETEPKEEEVLRSQPSTYLGSIDEVSE